METGRIPGPSRRAPGFSPHPARTAARTALFLAVFFLVALLAGCGSGPRHKGGVPGGRPYTVFNKRYYPLASARGFVEEGLASWYGPGFHGKSTASGEPYDQHAMTAAHKILPLGSVVRVTHLGNGRSIVVRINDRGPFVDDRIIDLSRAGGQQLGLIGRGTARVRVASLDAVPGIRDDGDMDGDFFVQVGAFAVQDNARRLVQRLQDRGLDARFVRGDENDLWNVQVGPWPELFKARNALPDLRREFPGAFLVRGDG